MNKNNDDNTVWEDVKWTVSDVKALLVARGYVPSDDNARRVIDICGHHFRDRLISLGWDLLDTFLEETNGLEDAEASE